MNEVSAAQPAASQSARSAVLRRAEELAARWSTHRETFSSAPPLPQLKELHAQGLLTAPLPASRGGQGLGTEPGGHLPLLRLLATIGGADLALGRIYEGHVNALILIHAYGAPAQQAQAAADARAGLLFGVWNTGDGVPMRLADDLTLHGCKGFATGAAFVQRPVVTAERNGWQMTLPRMDDPAFNTAARIDRSSWQPYGMESSASYTVDFTGIQLRPDDLIGTPGDLYRDPLFRGGAIRFAAVQAGAVLRLASLFTNWLKTQHRTEHPYQITRTGEIALAAHEAALWIERAAELAEDALVPDADPSAAQRMVDTANMTRLAIERIATETMPRIIAGVGAHGLLRPAGFERVLRDLTMYLRQPNPDGALADLGRSALGGQLPQPWLPDES